AAPSAPTSLHYALPISHIAGDPHAAVQTRGLRARIVLGAGAQQGVAQSRISAGPHLSRVGAAKRQEVRHGFQPGRIDGRAIEVRSEGHTSELQSPDQLL